MSEYQRPNTSEISSARERYVNRLGLTWGYLRGKKVLDLGAGEGYFAQAAEKHGVEIFSVDRKTKWLSDINSSKYTVGEAKNLPFKSETFDLVISNGGPPYHLDIEDIKEIFPEVSRVLKRPGEFRFGTGILSPSTFPINELLLHEDIKFLRDDKIINAFWERFGAWYGLDRYAYSYDPDIYNHKVPRRLREQAEIHSRQAFNEIAPNLRMSYIGPRYGRHRHMNVVFSWRP